MLSEKLPMNVDKIGPHLGRKREERGMTLQELAEKTRIKKTYLERIERGEFDRLPPMPYRRGFVRAYATYIGVDPDAVVRRFNLESGMGRA